MDRARITRLRWRLHGAWLWPSFLVLTVLDGLIVHWLPVSGDSESPVAGLLIGAFLGLAGIAVLAPLAGIVLRRLRPDMPKVVARDYTGTAAVTLITLLLLTAGLAHRGTVNTDRRALQDAIARAQAFIGTNAPPAYRVDLRRASAYELQPPTIYRVCVPNVSQTRTYCVVVHRNWPFARSVSFSGYEPNSVLAQGTQ